MKNEKYCLVISSYGSIGSGNPGQDGYEIAKAETLYEIGFGADDLIIHKNQTKVSEYEIDDEYKIVKYWLVELRDASRPVTRSERHEASRWMTKNAAIAASLPQLTVVVEYFDGIIRKSIAE